MCALLRTSERIERFTSSGVRLRLAAEREGKCDWLFVPGGPGLGSESLEELVHAVDVPGRSWLVDLPGDGSNVSPPGTPEPPYSVWPHVLVEAAKTFPRSVMVGHSTGGMYILSVPELEDCASGIALVSSAPDARWRRTFGAMTARHPLPAVDEAAAHYTVERTPERLRDVAVASAEWNFTSDSIDRGRELLGRMPYNPEAVDWSERNFDDVYESRWWPRSLPTLIVSGEDDRIVDQALWEAASFGGEHVIRARIEGAAHFPWLERPREVRAAFHALDARLAASSATGAPTFSVEAPNPKRRAT